MRARLTTAAARTSAEDWSAAALAKPMRMGRHRPMAGRARSCRQGPPCSTSNPYSTCPRGSRICRRAGDAARSCVGGSFRNRRRRGLCVASSCPMITFPSQIVVRAARLMMLSPVRARSFHLRLRCDPACDEVEIILDRKIPPRFVGLLPNQLLLVHAPVMPEDGCAIVKSRVVPIAGRAQLEDVHVSLIALRSTSTGSRGLCRALASISPTRGA